MGVKNVRSLSKKPHPFLYVSPFSLVLQFLGDRADVAMLVLPLLIRQKGTAKPKGESAEKNLSVIL